MSNLLIYVVAILFANNLSIDDLINDLDMSRDYFVFNFINFPAFRTKVKSYLVSKCNCDRVSLDSTFDKFNSVARDEIDSECIRIDSFKKDLSDLLVSLQSNLIKTIRTGDSIIKEGTLAWLSYTDLIYIDSAYMYKESKELIESDFLSHEDYVVALESENVVKETFGVNGLVAVHYRSVLDNGGLSTDKKVKLIDLSALHVINDIYENLKYFLENHYTMQDYYTYNKIYGYCSQLNLMVM